MSAQGNFLDVFMWVVGGALTVFVGLLRYIWVEMTARVDGKVDQTMFDQSIQGIRERFSENIARIETRQDREADTLRSEMRAMENRLAGLVQSSAQSTADRIETVIKLIEARQ